MDSLPDDLILDIFVHLTEGGPTWSLDDRPWFIQALPYRCDKDEEPRAQGMRSYPFLGQVCKRWKSILGTPIAKRSLWSEVVIDFGHELVTAIHMPLAWSNERPNAEEYSDAFHRTSLSSAKIIDFITDREATLTSLVISNSEGFWGDEGEYLDLSGKHNFQASHLGFLLGRLGGHLQELCLLNCNDIISSDPGVWTLIALCPYLRVLSIEGLNCRVPALQASELSRLPKLESLSLIGEEHLGQWIVGLDHIPPSWARLSTLKKLELRGHHLLDSLPIWLKDMKGLTHLDIGGNNNLSLMNLTQFTQLEVLSLQNLDLCQPPRGPEDVITAKRLLPNLEPMSSKLRVLSLADNKFTRLPDCLVKLTALEILDFNNNEDMQVLGPLTNVLGAMACIRIMDFRGVHKERGTAYWSDAKCTTMKNLAAASKLLRRRKYVSRVMLDQD